MIIFNWWLKKDLSKLSIISNKEKLEDLNFEKKTHKSTCKVLYVSKLIKKNSCLDIAEILLMSALNTNQSIKSHECYFVIIEIEYSNIR